tara:strand:+ start:8006 stop:8320 length:315 start_codon:yes stop_codon:yes gene_type:complete
MLEAGILDVSAARGEQISIACTSTATLTSVLSGNPSLQMLHAKYQIRGPLTYCQSGVKYIEARPIEAITIGGKLNLLSGADAIPGYFSTHNQGGMPITFTITYE